MSNRDDIAAAELASIVGGHLKSVNEKMIDRPSNNSTPIDPRQFLGRIIGRNNQVSNQTTNNTVIPKQAIIEEPKSRPAGSEIVGIESVNVNSLMIPMDGADPEMRRAIARHSSQQTMNVMPGHQPTTPKPQIAPGAQPPKPVVIQTPQQPITQEIFDLLKNIDKKLDLLLKRGKIQPRYKKKGN